MKKINLGCGGMKLDGWENYDLDVDIRKPLPFPNACADYIFAEHVVEHVTHKEAWDFFEECRRILKPDGVLRVAVPDVHRIWNRMTPEYARAVQAGGHGDGSPKSCIKAAIFEHGHQAAWTAEMLKAILLAVGFEADFAEVGRSFDPELNGIEQHGKTVGEAVNRVETSVVEGVKQ